MEVDQASVERRYAIAHVRQVAAMLFVNGFAQASGAPCCVVALSRWWPRERLDLGLPGRILDRHGRAFRSVRDCRGEGNG